MIKIFIDLINHKINYLVVEKVRFCEKKIIMEFKEITLNPIRYQPNI